MSSQQSWAAWLLDSYASSVSPVTSDSPYRHHDGAESISIPASDSSYVTSPSVYAASPVSAQSEMSFASNSSAYGPYVRTGRGGAGNFTWQSSTNLETARSNGAADLEAQDKPSGQTTLAERRKAAAQLEAINTQEAVRMRQTSCMLHQHGGRGGAGNYLAPGERPNPQRSPSLPVHLMTSQQNSAHSEPVYRGRGGAGNYAAAGSANGEKETQKEAKERFDAEKRRERIEEEVGGLLQPPPGAWLGGRRRSDGGFDEDDLP